MEAELCSALSAGKPAPAIKLLDRVLNSTDANSTAYAHLLADRAACYAQLGLSRKAIKVLALPRLITDLILVLSARSPCDKSFLDL